MAWPCRFKPASPTCCLVVLETVTQAGRQWRLWENLAWERKGGGGREGGSGAGWGPGQEAPGTSQAGPPSSPEHPFVRHPPLPGPPSPANAAALGCGGQIIRSGAPLLWGGPREGEGDASSLPARPRPVVTARVPPSPCRSAGRALAGHRERGRCKERDWMCPPGMAFVPPGDGVCVPQGWCLCLQNGLRHLRLSVLSCGAGGMPASPSLLLGSVASRGLRC